MAKGPRCRDSDRPLETLCGHDWISRDDGDGRYLDLTVNCRSGNFCAEFGRDVDWNCSRRVETASGLEKLPGNLCAQCGRDIDV